jgi:Tfp pilus assembly protein PilO
MVTPLVLPFLIPSFSTNISLASTSCQPLQSWSHNLCALFWSLLLLCTVLCLARLQSIIRRAFQLEEAREAREAAAAKQLKQEVEKQRRLQDYRDMKNQVRVFWCSLLYHVLRVSCMPDAVVSSCMLLLCMVTYLRRLISKATVSTCGMTGTA